MLFGHNTDVKVGDAVYHVQTEDRGTPNALIDTTVYCQGRVLHRRTNNYVDLLPMDAAHEVPLRKRIDDQHRAVMEEIRSGALKLVSPSLPTKEIAPAPKPGTVSANTAPPNLISASATSTLALELLNTKTWLSGKRANLLIAVRQKQNGIAVAGANVAAHIEGSVSATQFTSQTATNGVAQLEFEMPQLAAAESALVVEATHANAKGQLRFQLRSRPRVPTA